MELYERSNWINPKYEYLFGKHIIEYDIQSAGFSLIKEYQLLDDRMIEDLSKVKLKKDLVVKIGLIQMNDKDFAKALSDSFKDARRRFFEANKLTEENILSIKKDAFFTIDTECSITSIGKLNFRPKHQYSSYIKIGRIEFYIDTKNRVVDIKGLGQGDIHEKLIRLHKDGMLSFMIDFSRGREMCADIHQQSFMLSKFIRKYRNKELPIEYYRELSQTMNYTINTEDGLLSMDECPEEFRENLDISYNYYTYIVPIAAILI